MVEAPEETQTTLSTTAAPSDPLQTGVNLPIDMDANTSEVPQNFVIMSVTANTSESPQISSTVLQGSEVGASASEAPSREPDRPCPVCLDPLDSNIPRVANLGNLPQTVTNTDGLATTDCNHIFHTACIQRWIEGYFGRNCPVCRHVLVEDDGDEQNQLLDLDIGAPPLLRGWNRTARRPSRSSVIFTPFFQASAFLAIIAIIASIVRSVGMAEILGNSHATFGAFVMIFSILHLFVSGWVIYAEYFHNADQPINRSM
jgi:hypothetical protein